MIAAVAEPHTAVWYLFNNPKLSAGARRVLRPGGHLVLELGYNSGDRVRALLDDFENVQLTSDLAGIPRVVSCQLPLL